MADLEITRLLAAADGDPAAAARLYEAVYGELRALAAANLRRETAGHTLQPTALVNEAYLRLLPGQAGWENRRHFFGAAAQAMRRILVDHARRRGAAKRGDGLERVTFTDLAVAVPEPDVDVEALEEALVALEAEDARLAQVVTLRYFGGFDIEEIGEIVGISPATVKRDWEFARTWLYERLAGS